MTTTVGKECDVPGDPDCLCTEPAQTGCVKPEDVGTLIIDGNNLKIYFDEKYFVEEVEPLDGYAIVDPNPYEFTLVKEMADVNYKQFKYYYYDSFQIKNWKLEGLITEWR